MSIINGSRHLGRYPSARIFSSFAKVAAVFIVALIAVQVPLGLGAQGADESTDYGHRTIFRYRTYWGSSAPSWVSPMSSKGGIDHKDKDDIIRYSRGWGFDDLLTTDFNGKSNYLIGTSAINTKDSAGHDSFTIEAWFKADKVDGTRTLFSNTDDNRGFSLKVENGALRGLVNFYTLDFKTHTYTVKSDRIIEPGIWYYAAFRVKQGTYYDIDLFLNEQHIYGTTSSPRSAVVLQSYEHPTVGAEPHDGKGNSDFFDGEIYAVVVNNYAVGVKSFLTKDCIRDGGRYLGRISYHDYFDTVKGPDHRIADTINEYLTPYSDFKTTDMHFTPYLNDNYIPQGVESDGKGKLYVSMYWKDKDENKGKYPSIIVEIDAASMQVLRTMPMYSTPTSKYTGHVGGVSYWGNWLYVSDYKETEDANGKDIGWLKVSRFNLSAVPDTGRFNPATLGNNGEKPMLLRDKVYLNCSTKLNKISYMSICLDCDAKPVLWVGMCQEENAKVPDSKRYAHLYKNLLGFYVDSNGDIDLSNPDYILPCPVIELQGVQCYQHVRFNDSATGQPLNQFKFYLSKSYGDHPSHIYRYDFTQGGDGAYTRTRLDSYTFPAGVEDFGILNGKLWSVSETGGARMQKKSSAWDQLFPFIFAIKDKKATYTGDMDMDGVHDSVDAFPLDPAACNDTDNDGLADQLFCASTSGLLADPDGGNGVPVEDNWTMPLLEVLAGGTLSFTETEAVGWPYGSVRWMIASLAMVIMLSLASLAMVTSSRGRRR